MGDISGHERWFVEQFIVPERRDRYLQFLKGRKNRHKALNRLNHSLDLDMSKATLIPPNLRSADDILALLARKYVQPTCHVMADGAEEDGKELRLEFAVDLLLRHPWGIVLLFSPPPIAIYKEEDIGNMYLLGGDITRALL